MLRRARTLPPLLLALAAAACGGGAVDAEPRPAAPPVRIVAGSVLAAEVLVEIAPRARIAAVHYVAADPRYSLVAGAVKGLPTVRAEPEHLLSVAPDLVIVDAFTRPETLALLASAGVPVLRTAAPASFDDVAANVRRIGRCCHLEAAAEALVARMEVRLRELEAASADVAPWRLMSLDGGMRTLGRGSLFDAVVRVAGARNLAAEHGAGPFRITDAETVLAWRPDALVVTSDDEREERKWIAQVPGFGLVPAVRDDRLLFVPAALFGTTSHRLADTVAFVQDALRRWGAR